MGKILVAEDDPALSHLLTYRFKLAGFSVTTAANGLDAWHFSQSVHSDVVVTDHQMPGLTGVQLCERLRNTSEYEETPIILITGKSFELALPELVESLNLTATFAKPFSPAKVVRAVEQCLALPV